MSVLDTHVWIWWVSGDGQLSPAIRQQIDRHREHGLGVSAVSCLEVAMLVACGRLELAMPTLSWIELSLASPGVHHVPLTPAIAVESTLLPGSFHRDPADRLPVATSRVLNAPILSLDRKIIEYSHVEKA